MKVLQLICSTGFYGAERWVLALAKGLTLQSDLVCDLAVTKESDDQDMRLSQEYRLQQLGKSHEIPLSGRFDVSVIEKLKRLIESEGYDVIHTHGYKSDFLGTWVAKKANIKCVVTPHGFENSKSLKLRLFIWLGCRAMRHADAVAPLSRQLCDDVRRLGIDEKKLVYIQNGVDLQEVDDQIASPEKFPKPPGERWIGFIGQLIGRKNVGDILHVFDQLAGRHTDLRLKLIGDGESREELETLASSLACAEKIEFLGFRDDRLKILEQFDVFMMTSTLEGIPRCLMEAMTMGIPVVAYDIPGIDQLVVDQETGMLAPLGDKPALACCLDQLITNDTLTQTLAKNAREHVLENYSASVMASRYQQLYRDVCGQS